MWPICSRHPTVNTEINTALTLISGLASSCIISLLYTWENRFFSVNRLSDASTARGNLTRVNNHVAEEGNVIGHVLSSVSTVAFEPADL